MITIVLNTDDYSFIPSEMWAVYLTHGSPPPEFNIIPKQLLTPLIYETAVKLNIIRATDVPFGKRSVFISNYLRYLDHVKLHGRLNLYLPCTKIDDYINWEMCEIAINHENGGIDSIHYEYRETIINNHLDEDRLRNLTNSKEDYDYVTFAVKVSKSRYTALPPFIIDLELTKVAIKRGVLLSEVPNEFKTEEFCKWAVKTKHKNLSCLPEEFKNQEFYDDLIESNSEYIYNIPEEFINQTMCDKVIEDDPAYISDIPRKYITPTIAEKGLDYEKDQIRELKDRYIEDQADWDTFPETYLDADLVDFLYEILPTYKDDETDSEEDD
jgi:hypothetical protein